MKEYLPIDTEYYEHQKYVSNIGDFRSATDKDNSFNPVCSGIPHRNMSFQNNYDWMRWVNEYEAGERELTKEQRLYIRGKMYDLQKETNGRTDKLPRYADGRFAPIPNHSQGSTSRTRDRLAQTLNTTPHQIRTAVEFMRGVDCAEHEVPGIREDILLRRITPPMKYIKVIPRIPEDVRKLAVESLHMVKDRRGHTKQHT